MSEIQVQFSDKKHVILTKDGQSVEAKFNKRRGITELSSELSGAGFTQSDLEIVSEALGCKTPAVRAQKREQIFGGLNAFFTGFFGTASNFLGAMNNSWALCGNNWNDIGVGIFAAQPGLINMGARKTAANMTQAGNDYFTNMFQQMAQLNMAQYEQYFAQAKQKSVESAYKNVSSVYETFKQHPGTITKDNFKLFEDIYKKAGENNKQFSDEDRALADKIYRAPLIPEGLVQNKEDESNKLSNEKAMKLSSLLNKYNKAEKDKKSDIIKEEDYKTITNILAKKELTQDDIKTLEKYAV